MKRSVLLALLTGTLLVVCLVQSSEYSSGSPDSGYTITFNADGGTGTMEELTGMVGDFFLPECGFTAPPDMTFLCWSVGGENKNPYDLIEITEDTEITARWTGIIDLDAADDGAQSDDDDGNLTLVAATAVAGVVILIAAVFAFVRRQ